MYNRIFCIKKYIRGLQIKKFENKFELMLETEFQPFLVMVNRIRIGPFFFFLNE